MGEFSETKTRSIRKSNLDLLYMSGKGIEGPSSWSIALFLCIGMNLQRNIQCALGDHSRSSREQASNRELSTPRELVSRFF